MGTTTSSNRPADTAATDKRGWRPAGINVRNVPSLSKQFLAEAHAGYSFYTQDVDWDAVKQMPLPRRIIFIVRAFFRSVLSKLSPARRLFLVAALVFYFLGRVQLFSNSSAKVEIDFQFFGFLILFTLLVLELSDRVTMKRDLEIAREIQKWLVPGEAPAVPGGGIAFATRPQNSVAGDYYDAFYIRAGDQNPEKLMLVIADVAGKSVPAALLMATFQASLRTLAGQGISLERMIHLLNQYASEHSMQGSRFTTAVLAEFDPTSNKFMYVNAGHNPLILRRANGEIDFLSIGGIPLGIDVGSQYEIASVDLHSGDAVIFYTDGVIEALNQKGEELGEPRWRAAIIALPIGSAKDSLEFLMHGVDEFVGPTRQHDDITCLVFRLN